MVLTYTMMYVKEEECSRRRVHINYLTIKIFTRAGAL